MESKYAEPDSDGVLWAKQSSSIRGERARQCDDGTFRFDVAKPRSCHDLLCIALFLAFWAAATAVSRAAFAHGEPGRLVYATDTHGNTCGVGALREQRYIYYPALDASGSPRGVCLSRCPRRHERVCVPRQEVALAGGIAVVLEEQCDVLAADAANYYYRCFPQTTYSRALTVQCTSYEAAGSGGGGGGGGSGGATTGFGVAVPSPTPAPTPASCANGARDGNETGVDCGGAALASGCPGCALGAACAAATDCATGRCVGGACAALCGGGASGGEVVGSAAFAGAAWSAPLSGALNAGGTLTGVFNGTVEHRGSFDGAFRGSLDVIGGGATPLAAATTAAGAAAAAAAAAVAAVAVPAAAQQPAEHEGLGLYRWVRMKGAFDGTFTGSLRFTLGSGSGTLGGAGHANCSGGGRGGSARRRLGGAGGGSGGGATAAASSCATYLATWPADVLGTGGSPCGLDGGFRKIVCGDGAAKLGDNATRAGCLASLAATYPHCKTQRFEENGRYTTHSMEAHPAYRALQSGTQSFLMYFGQLQKAASLLFVAGMVAVALSLLWLLASASGGIEVVKWAVLSSVAFVVVGLAVFTLLLFVKGGVVGTVYFNGAISAAAGGGVAASWYATGGWLFLALTALALWTLCGLADEMKVAVAIIKLSSGAVRATPLLPLFPFVYTAAMAGVLFYNLAAATYMLSAPGVAASTASFGRMAAELALVTFTTWWTFEVLRGMGTCTIAGAVSEWYWKKRVNHPNPSPISLWAACKRMGANTGSIIFGALLLRFGQLLLLALGFVARRIPRNQAEKCCGVGHVVQLVFHAMRACLQCVSCIIGHCLSFLTSNAFVVIAMQGGGFCASTKRAFHLSHSQMALVEVVNFATDVLLSLVALSIALTSTAIFFVTVQFAGRFPNWFFEGLGMTAVEEITLPALPTLLCFVFCYALAECFLDVFQVSVQAVFMCYAADVRVNYRVEVGPGEAGLHRPMLALEVIKQKEADVIGARKAYEQRRGEARAEALLAEKRDRDGTLQQMADEDDTIEPFKKCTKPDGFSDDEDEGSVLNNGSATRRTTKVVV